MNEDVEYKNGLMEERAKFFMSLSTFLFLLVKLLFFCVGGYIAYYITVLSLPPFSFSSPRERDEEIFFILRVVFYIITFIAARLSAGCVERAFHFLKTKK